MDTGGLTWAWASAADAVKSAASAAAASPTAGRRARDGDRPLMEAFTVKGLLSRRFEGWGRRSAHLEDERGRDHLPVDPGREKHPPLARRGHEHADLQLSGRGRAAGDLRPPEHARAAARARSADVGVEVVQAALAEEDRVREG